ncbi:MAG: TRAP transporter large permease subunit, partial [Pseudomonadota bacterium]
IPYVQVAAAAALPAILYFVSLFIQIDAYAGKAHLKGIPDEEVPTILATFREGWYYLGAFALLVFLLIVLQREAVAPYFATAALLFLNQFSPEHRLTLKGVVDLLYAVGKLLIELVIILSGVGLIVGALSITGLSGTLVNDLLSIADNDVALLLLMGALTSFVLGIGMTVTAAYIFLAIVLAPALVSQDLAPLSVHLFILYWAMLSYITPPVALGAYAAASIANASPLKTGFSAMRLGSVIYFIPFIFVLDSAFILEGDMLDVVLLFVEAVIGVWLVCGALQRFLPGLGDLDHPLARALVGTGGLMLALPDLHLAFEQAPGNLSLAIFGIVSATLGIYVARATNRLKGG